LVTIDDFSIFSWLPSELAYLGILVISFILNIIPFLPVPDFPVLVTATFDSKLDPHLIALYSSLGMGAAKMVIFYASYYGRKFFFSAKAKENMLPLQRLLARYGWGGAFAATVTPIPDDLVYIPLGLAKYSPWKFATAVFAGKFIQNEFIVWGAIYLGRPFVENIIGYSTSTVNLVAIGVASVAVLVVMVYFFPRIDYAKIIGKWFPWTLDDQGKDKNGQGQKQ